MARLDRERVRPLVEYLAERIGVALGDCDMTFRLSNGSLRRTDLHAGPVRNEELEALAVR